MKLSVIISNCNDTSMLSITIRSCLEEFKLINHPCEVIIVDNSDDDIYSLLHEGSLFSRRYKNIKVIRQPFRCLFSSRDTAAKNASGEYLICLDSHMLVGHGLFRDLISFMDSHDTSRVGFAHAPITWAHQHDSFAKHDRLFGPDPSKWEWNTLYTKERKMSWKGMPWICRRSFYLNILNGYGALSQHRMSWPGDPYLGIKSWLLGYESWAVPTSPGIHLGPWPNIDEKYHKFRKYSTSGSFNPSISIMLSMYILGDEEAITLYGPDMCRIMAGPDYFVGFKDHLTNHNLSIVKQLAQNDLRWLREHQTISFKDLLNQQPWGPQA